MQEELGLTVYAPVGCRGRRGVRLVGLARGGVICPFVAIVIVTNHEVEGGEHGYESALELQEGITPVDRGPVGGTERGPLGLGREGEGLVVRRHSRRLHGDARRLPAMPTSRCLRDARRLPAMPTSTARRRLLFDWRRKEKRSSRTLSANWENSVDAGRTTLGAALDAGGRSGPRWTSDA